MSQLPLDSNTYYGLQNFASDYYFGFGYTDIGPLPLATSEEDQAWQFTRYPVTDNTYLIRPQNTPDLCLSTDSADLGVLVECTPDTQWRPAWLEDEGGYVFGRETRSSVLGLYISVPGIEFINGSRLSTSNDQTDLESLWGISSVAAVDDIRFSMLPFETAGPTTTAAATTPNPTTAITTTRSTPTSASTSSVVQKVELRSELMSPRQDDASNQEFFSPRVNEPLEGLLQPENVMVTCRLCSADGGIEVRPSSDDFDDLLDNGRVELALIDFNSRIDLEIQLLPGFTAADAVFQIARINARENITNTGDAALILEYNIGIPLSVTLGSPVTIRGGLEVSIDNLVINIDPGEPSDSDVSGAESVSLSALDFSFSTPDIPFVFTTGLQIEAIVSVEYDGAVNVSGAIDLTFGLPEIEFRVQPLDNVDDNCTPGGSFANGVLVTSQNVGLTFGAEGRIELNPGPDWRSPVFTDPSYDLPDNFVPQQCLTGDRLENGLRELALLPGGRGPPPPEDSGSGGRGGGFSGSAKVSGKPGWSILAMLGAAVFF